MSYALQEIFYKTAVHPPREPPLYAIKDMSLKCAPDQYEIDRILR